MGRGRAVRDSWQGAFSQQQISAGTHFVGVASGFPASITGSSPSEPLPRQGSSISVSDFSLGTQGKPSPHHAAKLDTLSQGQSTNKYIPVGGARYNIELRFLKWSTWNPRRTVVPGQ